MVSKNNIQHKMEADAKRVPHYGLRKLGIGVASVLLGTTLYFGNAQAVRADIVNNAGTSEAETEKQTTTSNTLNGTEVPLTTSTTSEKDNGTDKAATDETQDSEQKVTADTLNTNTNVQADNQTAQQNVAKSMADEKIAVSTTNANQQPVAQSTATTSDQDTTTITSTQGDISLSFDKPNGGVIGQTWDSANGKNNNLKLTLHLSDAKAGDKIVIKIPGADTFTIPDLALDGKYGTVIKIQDPDTYLWTITVNITNDVSGTLNLDIPLNAIPNGAYGKPTPLHDPMGDTPKEIQWWENGKEQDNTGLTFISRQQPSWNPDQTVTDNSLFDGKQLINNSQITYSYAVNEDTGVVASKDGNPYESAQVNSAVNYGTTITIPMPKGFVLDQVATNKLITQWYDGKLSANPITITQAANGDVVIKVPKGQGFQYYQRKPAYQFVGHYENVEQPDKTFTLTGGYITIVQKLDDDGTKVKKFTATTPVSDTFYGKKDKIKISNVSSWVKSAWKDKGRGQQFLPYWSDQHDQVIAYGGFNNGFVAGLSNADIQFTIPDGMVVHGLRVPNIAGITSYEYAYTLDDGSKHTGTVAAGGTISVSDDNRTITNIDLKTVTIPAKASTNTADKATGNNKYDDIKQQYTSQDNTGTFEFVGHLGATKRDGKTKLQMGESLYLKMSLNVPLTGNLVNSFVGDTSIEAIPSADTSSIIAQVNGIYLSDNLSVQLHVFSGYSLSDLESNSNYIKDPIFYVVLPKGVAYAGIFSTNDNSKNAKVSISKDDQGNTIVKLDYTGYQYDIRQDVDFNIKTTPDITNGRKVVNAFVYSPTTDLTYEWDREYSVPVNEKTWFDTDHQNEHLYDIGSVYHNNNFDVTKAASIVNTISWAQGNQDLEKNSTQGNAKADGKQDMSFAVWINNGSTDNIKNSKTIINLPTKSADGKGFNFHLTGPIEYTGDTPVTIKYSTEAVDLSRNSTQVGYQPNTTNFVTADQISDWSSIRSILVEVSDLQSGTTIGRLNINGKDPDIVNDGGQTGYLATGLYADNYKPYVNLQAASVYVAPVEQKTVTYQFVDDDDSGKTVGNPVIISGKPGSTQTVTLTVPDNYVLTDGQSLPNVVTIGDTNQKVDIHLKHAKDNVSDSKTITRTINYMDSATKKMTSVVQSAKLDFSGTKDKVTGNISGTWSTSSWDEFDVPAIAGYTPNQTIVASTEVDSNTTDQTVNITYSQTGDPTEDQKDVANIIQYVDKDGHAITGQDGNAIEQLVSGQAGAAIKLQIPAGYHVEGGNVPSLTISSKTPVQKVVVVKDQTATDTPEPNVKDTLNIIKYVDENGNVVKTDTATGHDGTIIAVKVPDDYHVDGGNVPIFVIDPHNPVHIVTITKDQHDTDNPEPVNKDVANIIIFVDENGKNVGRQEVTGKDGDRINVKLPDGYHVEGGNLPQLTISSTKPVQTVNVVKDQHDTDNPEVVTKPVLNIIKYVDENGNVVKTETVTGKLGDQITLTLPAGYHFKNGETPNLVITESGVQIVNVVKDRQVTPENPTINDHDKKNGNNSAINNNGASQDNNGKKVSTSSTGQYNNANNHKQSQLPQTGNESRNDFSAAGLALASLTSLIGLAGFKKKRD